MNIFLQSMLLISIAVLSQASSAVDVGSPAKMTYMRSIYDTEASVRLNDYWGKTVLIDFWASWCAPCKKALPELNRLRNQYRVQGFEVLAVNVDEDPKDGLRFLEKFPVDYPVGIDPKGRLASAYNVEVMPTSLIIKNGKVIYIHRGFKEGDAEKLEEVIRKHLLDSGS